MTLHMTEHIIIYSIELTELMGYLIMIRIYKSTKKAGIDQLNKERCIMLGEYIVETNGTVRETANAFGISKSTVHKDVTEKLKCADRILYADVRKVLERNKEERHLRGGQATKKKYEAKRKIN